MTQATTGRFSLKLLLFFALVAAIAFLPRLVFNPIQPTDVGHHVMWIKHFVGQLLQGDLVPRWLYGMQGGFGSPIFYFYPPVAYYAAALFAPFLLIDSQGWYLIFGSAWLALALSMLACYAYLIRHMAHKAALWGALLYLLLPFHLIIDLHFRFALAELWAFVWLPLLLWEAEMMMAGKRRGMIGFAFATAGLALSHVPSLVLCMPLFVGYVLLATPAAHRIRRTLEAIVAGILGMGIAGYFLVPAWLLKSQIHLEVAQEGHFHFSNHFLFRLDVAPIVRFFVYPLNGLVLFIVGIAVIAYIQMWRKKTLTANSHALMLLIAISFIMMTPLTEPLWQHISILQNTQFPWRFMVPVCLFATVLLAAANTQTIQNLKVYCFTFAVLAIIPPASMLAEGRYSPPLTMTNPGNRIALQYSIEPTKEAVPVGVDIRNFWPSEEMRQRVRSNNLIFGPNQKYATATQSKDGSIMLDAHCNQPCDLHLRPFYFPGWQAENKENGRLLTLSAAPVTGQIALTAPPGENHIHIYRTHTREENIGLGVSLIALTWLLSFWWWVRRQEHM